MRGVAQRAAEEQAYRHVATLLGRDHVLDDACLRGGVTRAEQQCRGNCRAGGVQYRCAHQNSREVMRCSGPERRDLIVVSVESV
jgi:hypothetical protein